MKGALEVENLSPALAMALGHVLTHFPIHRRLEAVLDREGAALDEKVLFERRQTRNACKYFDKLGIILRVNIGVCDLDLGRAQQIALYVRVVEARMIEAHGHGPEKPVEIDQSTTGSRIVKIGAATFFQIDNDLKTVEQNMIAQHVEHTRRVDRFFIFALTQTRPRSASRLREHGRHTHPLRVAFGTDLVNRCGDALLLLLPERISFVGRLFQSGVVVRHFRVVGNVALDVAVQKIALFQPQRLTPLNEPFHLCRVNGAEFIQVGSRDPFGDLFQTVMVRRS